MKKREEAGLGRDRSPTQYSPAKPQPKYWEFWIDNCPSQCPVLAGMAGHFLWSHSVTGQMWDNPGKACPWARWLLKLRSTLTLFPAADQ